MQYMPGGMNTDVPNPIRFPWKWMDSDQRTSCNPVARSNRIRYKQDPV